MIDGAPGAEVPVAVEAVAALGLGEWPADPLQADPLCTEQELIEPPGVGQVAVAGGDPGRPFGLDQRADERGEADQPAADTGPQPQAVVEIGPGHGVASYLLAPGEVIDEPVLGRVAAVPEPLQLGQRHPDHHGEQVCLQVLPAARVRGTCVLEARAGRQVAGGPPGGQLGGNVVLRCPGQHAGLIVPALTSGQQRDIAAGRLLLDQMTGSFIRAHLSYRFAVHQDGAQTLVVERAVRVGSLPAGRPYLNPL